MVVSGCDPLIMLNKFLYNVFFFFLVGVICVAPVMDGWYRAQVTAVYDDNDECDVKFVDYGGFSRLSGTDLRQIR